MYIAQPALTFIAYLRPYDQKIMINALYVFLFSVILHALFAVVAMLCFKKAPDSMKRMLRFATIFSNVAFMGIPLIAAVLEDTYPGATVYALLYSVTFNIFLWSLGAWICTNGRDTDQNKVDDFTDHKRGVSIIPALVHPTTIASAIGLIFFIFPIEGYVPAPAATSATMFAEKFDCDAIYVSRLVTVSTLVSIVTIPLLLLLV